VRKFKKKVLYWVERVLMPAVDALHTSESSSPQACFSALPRPFSARCVHRTRSDSSDCATLRVWSTDPLSTIVILQSYWGYCRSDCVNQHSIARWAGGWRRGGGGSLVQRRGPFEQGFVPPDGPVEGSFFVQCNAKPESWSALRRLHVCEEGWQHQQKLTSERNSESLVTQLGSAASSL
jgi:hypothetical protein